MKRTINETKAQRGIMISILMNTISLWIFGFAIRKQSIKLGFLAVTINLIFMVVLVYSGYSLGWEYKRLSLEEDAKKLNNRKKKK